MYLNKFERVISDDDPIWLENWVFDEMQDHFRQAEILKRLLKRLKYGKKKVVR